MPPQLQGLQHLALVDAAAGAGCLQVRQLAVEEQGVHRQPEVVLEGVDGADQAVPLLAFEPVDKRMQTPADQRWGLFRVVTDPPTVAGEPSLPAPVVNPHAKSVLSRREREVAALIADGKSNRCIAEELYIASSTVERHVANILNKLGYRSRTQIAAWAVAIGLAVM